MRLLVDGRALVNSRGGVFRYLHQVVHAIGRGFDHETVLAVPAPSGLAWPNERVREAVWRVPQRGRFLESVFRHGALPWAASRERASVLWQPSFVVPHRAPCPVVVTIHDLAFDRLDGLMEESRRRRLRRIVSASVDGADAVIADSHATANDLVDLYGVDPAEISVVHLGVSDHFHPIFDPEILARARARLRIPDPYLLFVGTLERRKNVCTLIEAYDRLVKCTDLPHALVIAGRPDNDAAAIVKTIRRLGLEKRVRLLSFVADEDLPFLYSGASAFAYPSLYEGFGIPVLEALACGAPCVISDVSSLPEIAGDVAETVDPRDPDAIACALERALSDGPGRRERVERGIRHARRFTWERAAAGTVAALEAAAS